MACNSGNEIKQVQLNARVARKASQCLELEPNVAGNIDGAYLEISSTTIDYYFYINTDPVITGKTGVLVTVATNATAAQVATAFESAINAMVSPKPFSATRDGAHLVIINNATGEALQAPATTGFTALTTLTVIALGLDFDLGLLSNDSIAIEKELSTRDITAHQYGTTPVDQLFTGVTASVELTLLEFSCAMKEKFYKLVFGNSYTDSLSNVLLGIGSKMFGSTSSKMVTLILSPVQATGNECENYYIWRTLPSIPNEEYFREEEKKATITFTAFIDRTKPSEVDVMAMGLGEDLLQGLSN